MKKEIKVGQVWQDRRVGSLIQVVIKLDNVIEYCVLSSKNRNLHLICSIKTWHDRFMFVAEDLSLLPINLIQFKTDTSDKSYDEENQKKPHARLTASDICQQAIEIMKERGKTYDKSNGAERSMLKTVTAFNALTGHELTEEQGWQFMTVLKLARSQQGEYKADNYLDGTAYFALAGECASVERKHDLH